MTFKKILFLSSLAACLAATPALAQDGAAALHSQDSRLDVQAGLNLSIPFGGDQKRSFDNRAKLQFSISTERNSSLNAFEVQNIQKREVFSLGFDEVLKPTVSIAGEDRSRQFFKEFYEGETYGSDKHSLSEDVEVWGTIFLSFAAVGALIVAVDYLAD